MELVVLYFLTIKWGATMKRVDCWMISTSAGSCLHWMQKQGVLMIGTSLVHLLCPSDLTFCSDFNEKSCAKLASFGIKIEFIYEFILFVVLLGTKDWR